MSDMQRPPSGGNAITDNLSVANPNDAAYMVQSGAITQDMSMKDYLESVYKLPITSPVKAFAEAIKSQTMQRKPMGKMQAMAGNTGRPASVQRPPSGGMGASSGMGSATGMSGSGGASLESLMGKMGG